MNRNGFTLIEILIGIAIISLIVGAVYVGYTSVIDIATTSQFSSAALSIIESRVEMVRNMRYEDIGTVGGVPPGILPQTEAVTVGDVSYDLTITVRYVDDPFDGTVFGSPSLDLSPADYKLVQFDATCRNGCVGNRVVSMATFVAEKRLENVNRNGHLLIKVINASGDPVPQANLRVVNPSAVPPVNLTTTADNNGQLLLLNVATGSAKYEITASKEGYSTDRTYPPNNPANALRPHATVATQQLTQITMVIDRVSTINITTRDAFCAAKGPFAFRMTGTKLIGELPNVPKFDQSLSVPEQGNLALTQMEWDTYTIVPTDTMLDIAGAVDPLTFTLDPATTKAFAWMLASGSNTSALVATTNASGAPINGARVTLTAGATSWSRYSGFWDVGDSDWSSGGYTAADIGIETASAGILILKSIGSAYATGSAQTLTSRTFDLGSSGATIERIDWTASTHPSATSVRFQLAANNDNASWQFIGPDGTPTSYFESPGPITIPPLVNKRYVRYRVYLETSDSAKTPVLSDARLWFSSPCVTSGHAYFDDLAPATTYLVTATASPFQTATTNFTTSSAWTRVPVLLSP